MSVCAVHADRPSVGTCPRCGRFVCAECAALQPCAECRARLAAKARPPARWLTRAIEVLLWAYAAFTVAMIPLGAEVSFAEMANPKTLFQPKVLVFVGVGTVYFGVWVLLIVLYLVWYAGMVTWARNYEATEVSTGTAVAMWFVPFVNFLHPYQTMRGIAQRTGIASPLTAWWLVYSVANVGSAVGSFMPTLAKGYSPFGIALAALEVAAAVLSGLVVRGFTRWMAERARP